MQKPHQLSLILDQNWREIEPLQLDLDRVKMIPLGVDLCRNTSKVPPQLYLSKKVQPQLDLSTTKVLPQLDLSTTKVLTQLDLSTTKVLPELDLIVPLYQ